MKSLKVDTGDQEEVYRKINEFFKEIVNKLEPKPLKKPSELEIRVNALGNQIDGIITDDFVHRLIYKQRVIAIVTETRDDLNYIVFDFFDNSDKNGY